MAGFLGSQHVSVRFCGVGTLLSQPIRPRTPRRSMAAEVWLLAEASEWAAYPKHMIDPGLE